MARRAKRSPGPKGGSLPNPDKYWEDRPKGRLAQGKQRSAKQREKDRHEVMVRMLKGHPMARIAHDMGLSYSTVCGDAKWVRNHQGRQLDTDVRGHMAVQLNRLQTVLGMAIDGFETSKVAGKITLTKLPDGSTAERTEYQPGGDVKYLNTAKATIESMNRLLGLDDSPVLNQTNVTVDASSLLAQPMSVDEYIQATQPKQIAEAVNPNPVIVKETLTSASGSVVSVESIKSEDELVEPEELALRELEDGW